MDILFSSVIYLLLRMSTYGQALLARLQYAQLIILRNGADFGTKRQFRAGSMSTVMNPQVLGLVAVN